MGRFLPGPHAIAPYEYELRRRLLLQTLAGAMFFAAGYLTLGLFSVVSPMLFPWDVVGFLAVCVLVLAAARRDGPRSTALAASWLVAAVNIIAAFHSQAYGIASPVTALFLPGIILAGMLIGGWFLPFWTALGGLFILIWGVLELLNPESSQLLRMQAVPQLLVTVIFWWSLLIASGGLVWLFARNLERATRASRSRATALTQTLQAVGRAAGVEEVQRHVLVTIANQLESDLAFIYAHDPETGLLMVRLGIDQGRVYSPDDLARLEEQIIPPPLKAAELPLWTELIRTRRPVVVQNAANDERLFLRPMLTSQGVQALVLIPQVVGTTVTGFYVINRRDPRPFQPEEIELAEALVQQATITQQLSDLAEEAGESAVIAERNRLAREIHDTLAQGLTGIFVQVEAAEDVLLSDQEEADQDALAHLAEVKRLARMNLAEARRSVYALRPLALEGTDLRGGLRRLLGALPAAGSYDTHLEVRGTPVNLPANVEGALLRIAQEAVNNAVQHAGDANIEVTLDYLPEQVRLAVRDDGEGFVPGDHAGGFGFKSVKERADEIGARLIIGANEPRGTEVICEVPYRRPPTEGAA